MSFKESITKTTDVGYFEGAIPVNYQYTMGMAGDKFFREIMEKGDFLASKCPDCGKQNIYPLLYCEDCFVEIKDYVSVGTEGELYSYTKSSHDFQGKEYDQPHLIGLVRFDGTEGGIIHRLEINENELSIGMKVRAKFKPANDRRGNIEDIICFEKA